MQHDNVLFYPCRVTRVSLISRILEQGRHGVRVIVKPWGVALAGWWLGVVLCVGLVVGCDSVEIVSVDRLSAPGLDEPFPHASMAILLGDYDRLEYDIPRAMKACHWGKISLTQGPAGSAQTGGPILRARALLPDGRTATMVAWPKGERLVSVSVRVGHRGDREWERDYLTQLGSILRGKPSRTQRFDQTLPKL